MARFYKPNKKKTPDTKHQAVAVGKLDHHGAGIGQLGGKPVFIDGALPGEEVLVQLTEQKSKFAKARLIKVLKAGEERVTPPCPHYAECGGCNMQHLSVDGQRRYKQAALAELMKKFGGSTRELDAPVTGDECGYRRRTRIALQWDKKQRALQFGFRRKASKQIVAIKECLVLAPQLNALLAPARALLEGFSHPEKLGHLELVLADSGPVMVLRHDGPLKENDHDALLAFAAEHQSAAYLMPESGRLEQLSGEKPYYRETGAELLFEPNNFIQVNQQVNQAMVAQAIDWLDLQPGENVLDLFCGIGNFSIPMAKRCQKVVGIEGVDAMVEQAGSNARRNQLENCEFYQANLEAPLSEAAWARSQFDKVLLDPARAGASGVIDQIGEFAPKTVVYVSCNPATLARDSQSLLAQGYRLTRLAMLDMFPHTSHLESMAKFEK